MTETVSIPPLVSGVTIYKTWKQSTVDKLKELKLGALFRFPRAHKRLPARGGVSQCASEAMSVSSTPYGVGPGLASTDTMWFLKGECRGGKGAALSNLPL